MTVPAPSSTPAPKRTVYFFLLAFAITWIVWVPRALLEDGFFEGGVGALLGTVWSYGPALAALLVARLTAGKLGVRELGVRLGTWRVGWLWYAIAVLGPLAMVGIGALINMALGGTAREAMSGIFFDGGLVAIIPVFLVLCVTDGLGEETGWRGYALPRMLEFMGPITASLILGVAWATWHLPLFWTEGASLFGSSILVLFARLPATSIIFTWLYQHTRESLLIAILFHAALNLFSAMPTAPMQVLWIGVAVQWAVALALISTVRRWQTSSRRTEAETGLRYH